MRAARERNEGVSFLQPAFWVVILLGVMILVHELGHFWAALSVGIKVETFSIGFGPRLFGFRRGDTDFRVSAILFGGYVRMLGEQGSEEGVNDPRSFQAKARWQRAIVIVAGPLMNVILAVALVAGLYMYAYPKQVDTSAPVVTSINPGSPAAQAGIQPGDTIIQLGNKKNPDWDYILTQEALNANHAIPVTVERRGRVLRLQVTPRMDPKEGIGVVGWNGEQDIQVGQVLQNSPAARAGLEPGDLFMKLNGKPVISATAVRQAVIQSGGKPLTFEVMRNGHEQSVTVTPAATHESQVPWQIGISFKMPVQLVKLGFGDAVVQSIRFNEQNAKMMFQVLGSLIQHRISTKSLAGPIGIAQLSSEAAQQGAWNYLFLMAFVSLQLAIINLLPIPILDGCTLLLLIIEMLLQREVSVQVKETILKLGFVFLMMVMVFVIYNDISRILTKS